MKILLEGHKTWWKKIPESLKTLGVREIVSTYDGEDALNLLLPNPEKFTIDMINKVQKIDVCRTLLARLIGSFTDEIMWSWRFNVFDTISLCSYVNNYGERRFHWSRIM